MPHLGLAHGDEVAGCLGPGGTAVTKHAVVAASSVFPANQVQVHLEVTGVGRLEVPELHLGEDSLNVLVVFLGKWRSL